MSVTFYIVKIVISALLIFIISEVAKRSSFFGGISASIPLLSVIAMVWIYIESGNSAQVISLSRSIFWLVIPSLVLFIVLPFLLKLRVNFYAALAISIMTTSFSYFLMIRMLDYFGIKL